MDPKSLSIRAVCARQAGNMELYLKLLILIEERDTVQFGPEIVHGPEDAR